MALPPVWQPDPVPARRAPFDWRGLLNWSVGTFVTVAMVFVLIAMIAFLVLVFTSDGDGEPHNLPEFVGAPAGENGIGQAVEAAEDR